MYGGAVTKWLKAVLGKLKYARFDYHPGQLKLKDGKNYSKVTNLVVSYIGFAFLSKTWVRTGSYF